jgi:hypothetical protein
LQLIPVPDYPGVRHAEQSSIGNCGWAAEGQKNFSWPSMTLSSSNVLLIFSAARDHEASCAVE